MDYLEYLLKLKRAINRGRRVLVFNFKDESLDITSDLDYALTALKYDKDITELKKALIEKEVIVKNLLNELVETKKELYKVRNIKQELSDRRLKYQLYMDSKDGKMIDKLIKNRIEDPDVAPLIEKKEKLEKMSVEDGFFEMSHDEEEQMRKELKDKYKTGG